MPSAVKSELLNSDERVNERGLVAVGVVVTEVVTPLMVAEQVTWVTPLYKLIEEGKTKATLLP